LKLYLELERMRFSDDFNYELQIANNVEADLVKIPPMIVQPYVENAIKHGLLHKKGNKYLAILFERVDEDILITIDDNGIGREKSNELNQIKKERHSSFSTEANSKRIELLNKERGRNIGVLFIDKRDEHGAPTGTTVVISIPLIFTK
jgi:LytS/YehU family sensor histidine kinase